MERETLNMEISLHALRRFQERICTNLSGYELNEAFVREWENAVYEGRRGDSLVYSYLNAEFIVRNNVVTTVLIKY